jgi:hypothetical protein
MNVIEGLRRIQLFWPGATFQMLGAERLDVMHRRLDQIAKGPAPETLQELIRRMDNAGLGVRGNLIVLSD